MNEEKSFVNFEGSLLEVVRIYLPKTKNILLMLLDEETHSVSLMTEMLPFEIDKNNCIFAKAMYNKNHHSTLKELENKGIAIMLTGNLKRIDGTPMPLYEINVSKVRRAFDLENGFPLAKQYIEACEEFKKDYEKFADKNQVLQDSSASNGYEDFISSRPTSEFPFPARYDERVFKEFPDDIRSYAKWAVLADIIARNYY